VRGGGQLCDKGYLGCDNSPDQGDSPDGPACAGDGDGVSSGDWLLRLHHLRVAVDAARGAIHIVDDVSIAVGRGETVALVGESGCGKSMTAFAVLRLLAPPCRVVSGEILLRPGDAGPPLDLLRASARRMRSIRGARIAMIFQEPMTALNPVYTVGEQIVEAIRLHRRVSPRNARARAVELLRRVSLPEPERIAREYPHRLSGGMLQRAVIAMALACAPQLLIADEPTTALDATTQREVLDLLRDLQAADGMGMLLITHDLGIVADVADQVYVMYAGRIVEHGPTADVLSRPLHPYTQGLLECTPRMGRGKQRLETIRGSVPDPSDWPSGCRFHPRCSLSERLANAKTEAASSTTMFPETVLFPDGRHALRRCVTGGDSEGAPSPGDGDGAPSLRALRPGHFVACWEAEHQSIGA